MNQDAPDPTAWANAVLIAINAAGSSRAKLGAAVGVTKQSVDRWLAEPAPPKPDVVFAIERHLGATPGTISAHLGYVPVGAPVPASVPDAIDADSHLSPTAKGILRAAYLQARQASVDDARRDT